MKISLVIQLTLPLFSCVPTGSFNNTEGLVVNTKYGAVKGKLSPNGLTRQFLGVPFAEPPIESRRFQAPIPKAPWEGIRPTQKYSYVCPQLSFTLYSENCLYLNVYAPAYPRQNQSLPVLLWFFGGAFVMGGGNIYGLYDGTPTVSKQNVIVVTFNYRVGVFGFLTTEELKGNYAIQDQRMAMQWVKENIEFFGGDPNQITCYGQSAGAWSIALHLTSRASHGLCSKAILMSAPITSLSKEKDEAIRNGVKFAEKLGCSDIKTRTSCLQKVSTLGLLSKQGLLTDQWTPTIDYENIFGSAMELIEQGKFEKVPLIIGTTRDESHGIEIVTSLFQFIYHVPSKQFSKDMYISLLSRIFREKAEQVLRRYPATDDHNTNFHSAMTITTLYGVTCSSRHVAKMFTRENLPVYQYVFNHVPGYIFIGPCSKNRVCHSVELPYVFDTFPSFDANSMHSFLSPFTRLVSAAASRVPVWVSRLLASQHRGYFARFFANKFAAFAYGNITKFDDEADVTWPVYTEDDEHYIDISFPIHSESHWKRRSCEFWDEIGYRY